MYEYEFHTISLRCRQKGNVSGEGDSLTAAFVLLDMSTLWPTWSDKKAQIKQSISQML